MSGTAQKYSAVLVSLLLTGMLAACGSDNREGGTAANVARVADEATCRVCHSTTIDPVSGRPLLTDFLTATDSHNQAGRVDGSGADLGCQGCHGGGAEHNGVGPIPFPDPLASNRCITCHTANGLDPTTQNLSALFDLAKTGFVAQCARCHTSPDNGQPSNPIPGAGFNVGVRGVHGANLTDQNCVTCHSIVQNGPEHGAAQVNDNSGVRAASLEFNKWSHHVTGVTLNPAHCAACHLEGTVEDGAIIVDKSKHMADAQVHLRNAADDSDMQWDPANPNHSTMDNFCMTCHSATGATSPMSVQIQAIINTVPGLAAVGKVASAKNPFGDTISNRYDKMQRPGVTDVSDQFNTANNSHHGVKGPRYTGRTRVAGARQIASPATFAGNSSATLFGARSTIYDAGNFNQLYVPLANSGGEVAPRTGAATLGDDSTLHCGDCHTVGQWRPGVATNAAGALNTVAIGAHGSNNEYLLRNSIGTDQRHTQNAYLVGNGTTILNPFTGAVIPLNTVVTTNPNGAFLVCYNCHAFAKYGVVSLVAGAAGNGHAGEYDETGRCNGIANTLPFNGYTTGKATDGTQFLPRLVGVVGVNTPAAPYLGEQSSGVSTEGAAIYDIQCLNCHNSGAGNAYGGIHGSANNTSSTLADVNAIAAAAGITVNGGAYIDGMGNVSKVMRFLPGLGNAMYVPGTLGGITGGSPATVTIPATTRAPILPAYVLTYTTGGVNKDTNWEQKQSLPPLGTPITFGQAVGGSGQAIQAGAGCYTLGNPSTPPAAASTLRGPSVTGETGPPTTLLGTWGGCVDHNAPQGGGDHGVAKKINRPVTY